MAKQEPSLLIKTLEQKCDALGQGDYLMAVIGYSSMMNTIEECDQVCLVCVLSDETARKTEVVFCATMVCNGNIAV